MAGNEHLDGGWWMADCRARRAIHYLLSTILVFAATGCSIAGLAAYKIAGPPPNPAKYTPAWTPMLVLVENYQQQSATNPEADVLARDLFAVLNEHGVAPLVGPEKLQELRDAKPVEFPTMPINRIGQAVGAAQVLYVELKKTDTQPVAGGEGYLGQAMASVKVIDAASGNTLWPSDESGGYPVTVSTKLGIDAVPSPVAVRQKLYTQLSDEIGRLFYKWKPEDMRPEGFTE